MAIGWLSDYLSIIEVVLEQLATIMRLEDDWIEPIAIDLFSGAGGTGYGFKSAGFRIIGAVEIDKYAAQTYEHNIKTSVTKQDISALSPLKFRRTLGLESGELDVLVGCPPCQGFTRMRNSDGANDLRNDLVLAYLQYVRAFKPRFAVFENVPGILRTAHGRRYFTRLTGGIKAMGYCVIFREVDAADYGVPQHRKRVIVIAGRHREEPPFPRETHGNPDSNEVKNGLRRRWITVREVISAYPKLQAGENMETGVGQANHKAPMTGNKVLQFIRRVPQNGGSRADVPSEYWLDCHIDHQGHRDVYGRIAWDRPSNVITSGCTNPSKGRFVHPEQDRALTPREAARLQGFPDEYVFLGRCISTQIGNAVPPPLAQAIAEELMGRIRSTHARSQASLAAVDI